MAERHQVCRRHWRDGSTGLLLQMAPQKFGAGDPEAGSVHIEQRQVFGRKVTDQNVRQDNLLDI